MERIERTMPNKEHINFEALDDLKDVTDEDIVELMTQEGIPVPSDITPDDFEVTKTLAVVILRKSTEPMSLRTALIDAFVERMLLVDKMTEEVIKQLETGTIKALLYAQTKILYSDEEIEEFKRSPYLLTEWSEKREVAKETLQ